ncbi:DUF4179 domain-containing protein [Gracilibacillus salitolerans]|uniref:DUF4179 domain-containing protein n=1 Tax=Gracilibacillus salitolerans TaxID=2663022 RepID=A0A5Q2TNP2_9BACI|nr:DUF4179 domain-containing protein [Gracilibacillus salitolerans]QGH34708.1 DUF4179 domain-containing protein [Gracilibacillus salitolerans]
MSNLKKQMQKEKKQLKSMQAPNQLEDRLRTSINSQQIRYPERKNFLWKSVAAIIIFSILIGYNYQGLAYYGKKIMGFDNVDVISNTLQNLNEAGMGQTVNKSITLENGVTFTVNGVMVDDNQLIIYYTATSKTNNLDNPEVDFVPIKISGFLTNSTMSSGAGTLSDDESSIKGTYFFEPPNGLAKKLTLHFQQSPKTLTFDYDPNKAMGASLKQKIDKRMQLNNGDLHFQTITASPTGTVIKGTTNKETVERISFDQIELVADGVQIELLGSSYGSKWSGGYKFEIRFDALPTDVSNLEIGSDLAEEGIEIISD